jgi:hypothetical protein
MEPPPPDPPIMRYCRNPQHCCRLASRGQSEKCFNLETLRGDVKFVLCISFLLAVPAPMLATEMALRNSVIQWDTAAVQGVRDAKMGMAARALAIVHTCMYDAWAAYDEHADSACWSPTAPGLRHKPTSMAQLDPPSSNSRRQIRTSRKVQNDHLYGKHQRTSTLHYGPSASHFLFSNFNFPLFPLLIRRKIVPVLRNTVDALAIFRENAICWRGDWSLYTPHPSLTSLKSPLSLLFPAHTKCHCHLLYFPHLRETREGGYRFLCQTILQLCSIWATRIRLIHFLHRSPLGFPDPPVRRTLLQSTSEDSRHETSPCSGEARYA